MKLQQKLLISNQEVPCNLQGSHNKFITHLKLQAIQCTQPTPQGPHSKSSRFFCLLVYNLLYYLNLLPIFLLPPHVLGGSTLEWLAFEPSDGEAVVLTLK